MFIVLSWLVLLVYAVAAVYYWREFASQLESDRKKAVNLLVGAISLHFVQFSIFSLQEGRIPVGTVGEALSSFVLITAAAYFLLERRLGDRSMGTFILPVFSVFLLAANLLSEPTRQIDNILYDVWFEFHVINMLLGNGAFLISFIASILYLRLAKELEKPEHSLFYRRLPSLSFFENISNAAVNLGLIGTTIGFALGVFVAEQVWQVAYWLDPKILIVVLTIFIYATHFFSRRLAGWRGKRAAITSAVGFGWVLFSFFIVSTLISSVHQFK